mgnify:CR=1 FL=1
MGVHYLTLKQIGEQFSSYITKKELSVQTEGTTITLNGEQIVILRDKNEPVKIKVEKDISEPVDPIVPKEKTKRIQQKKSEISNNIPDNKTKSIDNQGVSKWLDYQ